MFSVKIVILLIQKRGGGGVCALICLYLVLFSRPNYLECVSVLSGLLEISIKFVCTWICGVPGLVQFARWLKHF